MAAALGVLTFGAVEAMGQQRHCLWLTGQLGSATAPTRPKGLKLQSTTD